jgi:hypothetical protein
MSNRSIGMYLTPVSRYRRSMGDGAVLHSLAGPCAIRRRLVKRAVVTPQLARLGRRLLDSVAQVHNRDVAVGPGGQSGLLQVMLDDTPGRVWGLINISQPYNTRRDTSTSRTGHRFAQHFEPSKHSPDDKSPGGFYRDRRLSSRTLRCISRWQIGRCSPGLPRLS